MTRLPEEHTLPTCGSYRLLSATEKEVNQSCSFSIDMKNGKVNKRIPLKRIIFVKDGYIIREKKFESKKGLTLQIFVIGKQIFQVQLIDEVVYNSNYNQMFLLGKFRNDLFEETFNAFPFSRLFRFKF